MKLIQLWWYRFGLYFITDGRGAGLLMAGCGAVFIRQLANIPSYSYNKQQCRTRCPAKRLLSHDANRSVCVRPHHLNKKGLEYPIVFIQSRSCVTRPSAHHSVYSPTITSVRHPIKVENSHPIKVEINHQMTHYLYLKPS